MAGAALTLFLAAACGSGGGDGGSGGGGGGDAGGGEQFPTKPITLIVPLDAGSAPDSSFRKLASIAEESLGADILIVNKPGGAGTVGTGEVIAAEPDGYTIGMSAVAMVNIQPLLQDTTFDGPEDLDPLAQAIEASMAMFVRTDSGIDSVEELAERAKENPGSVTIGVAGANDLTDILGRQMAQELDVDIPTVPMGPGKQVLGVLNGTATAGISQPLVANPYVETGEMKFLGLFGTQAPPGVDAELFIDQGYDVEKVPYEFLFAPKGLPEDVRATLVEAFAEAIQSEEFQTFAEEASLIASYLGPDELAEKLAEDKEAYGKLIDGISD